MLGLRLTLFRKFALVLLLAFSALAAGSLLLAGSLDSRNLSEQLAQRVGNLAARVASALGRHDAVGNQSLADDFLATFGTDAAVRCAELREPGAARPVAAYPARLGCRGVEAASSSMLTLPVGDDGAMLSIRYSDAEISAAARQRALMLLGILVAGMGAALASASIGFKLIVGRRLSRLHQALSDRAGGQLRRTLEPGANDELGQIVEAYNSLLAREQGLEEALRKRNDELDRQSRRDPLTGLYNRRHFESWLSQQGVGAARQAGVVALIDVDHFKVVNDTHGHAVGDEVLTVLSQRFARALKAQDVLVRWGGEEFLFFAPMAQNAIDVSALAERVLSQVRTHPVRTSAGPLKVTVSLGLVRLPLSVGGHQLSMERAIVLADRALYAAKRSGRDRAVSVLAVHAQHTGQLALIEDDLLQAGAQGLVQLGAAAAAAAVDPPMSDLTPLQD